MKQFLQSVFAFIRKETVLVIAILLALISMCIILPDKEYISYIDFRTLGILFSLMAIVAGLQKIHVLDRLADGMLGRAKGIIGIVTILVLLCFFMSMLITNDVALITFVPLTLIIMRQLGNEIRTKWMLKTVVMQTIAANMGSMLTPIGNPQNLYLYGKAQISISEFIKLMLPYTLAALVILLVWIGFAGIRNKRSEAPTAEETATKEAIGTEAATKEAIVTEETAREKLIAYAILFILSLLAVAHILPFELPLVLVFLYVLIRDREILGRVDYSLLGTFLALFIFIGNLGRIPAFSQLLESFVTGREMLAAILASQVMSNVPAAVLLSGFTDNYQALIIGTNLGGLGTLIASMASLISFKYIAQENGKLRGKYLLEFTGANIVFLLLLSGGGLLLSVCGI